jgi:predicted amidohydrolase/predicted GNAT family acetyltransferase
MKICIAQTKSIKGDVENNIKNHLQLIERAIALKSDLIIFPELSITGYEPELAKEFATNSQDTIFSPFQVLADKNNISIGIGMPTHVANRINISMLIFQPNNKSIMYSKQLLHVDELPYFVAGNSQTYLNIKNKKIAIGICYETLQAEHFIKAHHAGANIYIASVAKSKASIEKAYIHFPEMAKQFNTPILMSNSVGFCDNFLSRGQSAVWNKNGQLINQLDAENQGLLIYDTQLETTDIFQLKIEKAQLADLEELFQIYLNGKDELNKNGLFQWTENYPTSSIIENDIIKGVLYTLKNNHEIIGAININEEQDLEYQTVPWEFDNSKVLVIHRLVVNPKHQGQGYARILMDFAENFASENGYTSIRLDAYSPNKRVIEFYINRNYFIRGDVHFSEREYPFHCLEKEI